MYCALTQARRVLAQRGVTQGATSETDPTKEV